MQAMVCLLYTSEITGAIKRYWKHGLFSNVQITAEKIEGNKIWLKISLTQRPRIADVRYHGVKKSERTDLENKLGMVKGMQITPNTVCLLYTSCTDFSQSFCAIIFKY